MDRVCNKIRQREAEGRHFSMVVVAEGAVARGGEWVYLDAERGRLGGVGDWVARVIEQKAGKETCTLVVAHVQRRGSPAPRERLFGLRYGDPRVALACVGK